VEPDIPSQIIDVEKNDVLGTIYLVKRSGGRVEFSMSGCFRTAPAMIAEVVEKIEAASRKE
jgi:hypothetical protein